MAWADRVNIERTNLLDSLKHVLAEWSQNCVKIVFESIVEITAKVIIHRLVAVMATERVAGEEHAIFLQPGVDRIRPVKIRRADEMDRFVAEI